MTWIKTIPFEEATGSLRVLYDRLAGTSGHVDNIMTAHSLRPHTMKGHMTLYKYVLHHTGNSVPKWFLECLGVYTSWLNKCDYCVAHHLIGMARLLTDESRTKAIIGALETESFRATFTPKEQLALTYARMLTKEPGALEQSDIQHLRDAGWADGEILELNQVVSYFCYANRTVLGLGVNTTGDTLGTSPSDPNDADSWSHV